MGNRTLALCVVLGWQGGTIHQVAEETGCEVEELLYAEDSTYEKEKSFVSGWFAARTCSLEFNREVNFPKNKGDLAFWLGAAMGMGLKLKEEVFPPSS